MMIGILAYGSLLSDPGWEIEIQTDHIIRSIETPFAVEFARQSNTRDGAPTLVPVPQANGIPVQAAVIVLKPDVTLYQARNILYRRERHKVNNPDEVYDPNGTPGRNKVVIVEIPGFCGLERVLYTSIGINIPEILDERVSNERKAEILAQAARDSLTQKTFPSREDGISYLDAARNYGIRTQLTDLYIQAVLHLANGSPDLTEARIWLAKQKGLIP